MNLYEMFALVPVVYLLLVGVLIIVADYKEKRIPNKYVVPAYPLWLVCAIGYSTLSGDWWFGLFLPLLCGIVAFIALYFVNAIGIVGMGDVKLILIMCLSLSWKSLWVWLVVPSIIPIVSLIVVLVFLLSKSIRERLKTFLPLAPLTYLMYGGVVATLFV